MESANQVTETDLRDMVLITGGSFSMGSESFYPEEKPIHKVKVSSFYIDKYTVTNRQYQKFVDETGYITVAERPLNPADFPGVKPELLAPGALIFKKANGPVNLKSYYNWWAWMPGTNWKHPKGPESNISRM